MPDPHTYSDAIRWAQYQRQLRRKELADLFGYAPAYISTLKVHGARSPESQERIARVLEREFGVSVEDAAADWQRIVAEDPSATAWRAPNRLSPDSDTDLLGRALWRLIQEETGGDVAALARPYGVPVLHLRRILRRRPGEVLPFDRHTVEWLAEKYGRTLDELMEGLK